MFTFPIFELYFSLILIERTIVMEAKQIEARIGDWPRVVNSIATKDALSRFYPKNVSQEFFQSSIDNYLIRHVNICLYQNHGKKGLLVTLCKQEDNEENH